MGYMNKTIADATCEELLHALINKNGLQAGPRKTHYGEPVLVSDVAIGPDATATVAIFNEDIKTLDANVLWGSIIGGVPKNRTITKVWEDGNLVFDSGQ